MAAVFLLWDRAAQVPAEAAIALIAFGAVAFFRVPAPVVIVGAGALGWGFNMAGLM